MSEHHELYEQDVAAYALGALEEAECTRFVRHLRTCEMCREDVDRFQVAVDALPRSVTPLAAPASLKAAVMGSVQADVAPAAVRRTGLRQRLRAIGRIRPRAATATVASVLAVGLVGGFALSHVTESDSGSPERTLSAHFDTSRAQKGSGNLMISGDDQDSSGTLRVHGMPALSSSETYQVWLQRNGEMIPKALFNVTGDGNGLTAVDGSLDDAQAVLVTREPAGGSRAPSGPPVVTVKL